MPDHLPVSNHLWFQSVMSSLFGFKFFATALSIVAFIQFYQFIGNLEMLQYLIHFSTSNTAIGLSEVFEG